MATVTQSVSSLFQNTIQSPRVALHLVKGGEENETPASSRSSSKRVMSTQAPKLNPAAPSPSGGDYLDKLMAYMASILAAQIQNAQNDETLNADQTQIANSMMQLSQLLVQKAEKEYSDYEAAVEAAKHESFWQKLAAGLGMIVGFAIGVITGDMALCAFSIAMGVFVLSGGSDALQNAIASQVSPSWAKALINFAIAAGAAIVTCGASGACSAEETAETTAEEASSAEAGNAASAAGNNGANAADNAANAVQEEQQTFAQRMQKFASKVAKNGFQSGKNFMGQTLQWTMAFNPWTDLTAASIDLSKKMGANVSDTTEQEISEIVGMIAGLAAAIWGGTMTGEGSTEGLGKKIADKYGEKALNATKNMLKFVRSCLNITSGGLAVAEGFVLKDMGDVLKKMGATQSAQTVFQAIFDSVNQQSSATQQNEKQLNDVYASINSRWNGFVQQYALEPQLMA